MKLSVTAWLLAMCAMLFAAGASADTIADAYAKEFTYLKAQKSALEKRIDDESRNRRATEREASARLEALRERFLSLSSQVNERQLTLNRLREDLLEATGSGDIVDSVVQQMQSTLAPYNLDPGGDAVAAPTRIANGFDAAGGLVERLSSMRRSDGVYYSLDGGRTEGTLIEVGNIAVFGASAQAADTSGALVPAGGGKLRLWEQPGSSMAALELSNNALPESIPMYLFENRDVEVAPPTKKTARSVIESGGIVGYIILALGAFGLLAAAIRLIYLTGAGSSHRRLVRGLLQRLANRDIDNAWQLLQNKRGAIPAVLIDVLHNIDLRREYLDDVIAESILRESGKLDRFGALILVIAAVAPLLGLLGTVTGMISTFDLITEFGTGDPKLLADGISVALVTTMLGLAVAIPLLLIGNLLSGWAQRIKDSMERAALLAVNEFETGYAVD